ncbi:MAG: A/G-specific adenine glycosylase [Porphyromonas sp.]|nr:A/G-specific adenine glycosylase [Porphyromonas sp.]
MTTINNSEERQQPLWSEERLSLFRYRLIRWFVRNGRALPWRGIKDPYKIWVSEIILQQTQVVQGWDYYLRFIEKYPTVGALAQAEDEEVLLLWQGLGYYSRAHNMLTAARQIVDRHGGSFPTTAKEVSQLKGIGPYTTAAIMSIAYDAPLAVVDGNVYRVLSRVEASEMPIDTTAGQKYYRALADRYLDRAQPGQYNQAIMDLGAMVCTPRNPLCHDCPLGELCLSRDRSELINLLPIKAKKTAVKTHYLDYFLYLTENHLFIEQRDKKGIWKSLYQFPLHYGTEAFLSPDEVARQIGEAWQSDQSVDLPPHKLTHRLLNIRIHICRPTGDGATPPSTGVQKIRIEEHPRYAFPKPLRAFLDRAFPPQK